MKKVIMYFLLMIMIIILLPMIFVGSCAEVKSAPVEEEHSIEEEHSSININVFLYNEKKTVTMPLEEYLKGVIAAEMPAEFEPDALKAQAVAARTYVYSRYRKIYSPEDKVHEGADICDNPAHCQAWTTRENAEKNWDRAMADIYWGKIEKAVQETEGLIIVYNGVVANPVFHSNSGGKTENAEDVWNGVMVPYLKSVVSLGEETTPEFRDVVIIKATDFCSKLKKEHPEFKINEKDVFKDIKILDLTEGGRVDNIKIGNITVKGTDFRRIFSLKSANFKIDKGEGNTVKIITAGYGHGVGMSQWGANYMAKNGSSYKEILKYYYQGVEIESIEMLEGL